MNNFITIPSFINKCEYKNSPQSFFKSFPHASDIVESQILKLETKQVYIEPNNKSYMAMINGDIDLSNELMQDAINVDEGFYEKLNNKNIDFIRCRPIKKPYSEYLKWELKTYKYTEAFGVRIFCCDYFKLSTFFENVATHDFMVYDDKIAFVHDYDSKGLIQGGWIVNEEQYIIALQSIFIYIKSKSIPYNKY